LSQEKRIPIGKRIDILRMQNVTPKLRRNVLNARRLIVTVSWENDRLKHRTKLLNARRLIVTVSWEHNRLKRQTKLLNARRLNRTVWKDNNRLKPTSKALNARRLNRTVWKDNGRLKPTSKALNARRLIVTLKEENVKRWDIDTRMIAKVVMKMIWQTSLTMKLKKQNNFYTGQWIQQTPISIGQLCVLYVIVSSSA
jgi:hypothetical protein